MSDLYENQISIIYDDDNNIKSLNDKDGKQLMNFEYDDGNINRITDSQGRMCEYEYDDGFLKKVIYPDGEESEFSYDNNGRLVKVKGIAEEAVRFAYSGSVLTITQSTTAERIDKDGISPCAENIVHTCTVTRASDYTTTVETKDGVTQYVFDRMGRAVTVYTKMGDKERSASYEYNGLNKAFSCGEVMSETNLVSNHDFTNGLVSWTQSLGDNASPTTIDNRTALQLSGSEDCYISQIINIMDVNRKDIPKNGVMVLSALAKARSMSVRHNKRITAYGKDLFTEYEETASNIADKLRNNRRFGLKAVVEYSGGIANDTYECTYDFYNNDWQLAALPIKIKDIQKVSKIIVYFDYSYNYGTAYVTDFKLCKCSDFTERTYDDDRNVVSEYDGTTLTEYEYAGKLPIKAVMTIDGRTYENKMRYDHAGALLYSRDYNGNCVENTYDEKGVLVKTVKYNENDSTSKYVQEYEYDEKGNLIAERDPRGEVSGEVLKTEYAYTRGLTVEEKHPGNRKTVYGYDYDTDAQTGMSSDDDGEANGTVYKYTKDMLTTTSHNGIDVNYAYDGRGRTLETIIADETIVSYMYMDGTTATDVDVVKATYADGTVFKTTTDNKNRKKTVEDITNGASIELLRYEYDGKSDRQKKAIDGLANITYDYAYSDELLTQTTYTLHGNNIILSDTYNDDDLLEKSEITIGGKTEQYKYAYDETPEHNLTDVELPNGVKQELERDALGRVHAISQSVAGKTIADENRYYLKYGDRTTDYISSMRFGINGNLDEQLRYKYDKAGNISEIYKNGILLARYGYDKLNRIVREDNKALDKTVVVTYDIGGNILAKTEYPFTLGSIMDKTPNTVMNYSYKAKGWRDQMTAFNGEKCEYDSMGRPTTYRGNVLTWSKYGTLSGYGNINYAYDANGVRLSKTVAGVQTKFYISGTKILRSIDNNNDIWYNYGVSGIQGITVNNTEYVFRKNAQGDVTHIYKLSNGELTLAARYEYDAWGNHEAVELDNSGIGAINPIRYRGYYYDAETRLYYLNARYYDPETGRFISADSTQYLEPNTINGLNLYAYCGNNPIMNVDPDGTFFLSILITTLVSAAFSAAFSVVKQGFTKGWDKIDLREVLASALLGGVMGGITAFGGALALTPALITSGRILASIGGVVAASFCAGIGAYTIRYAGTGKFDWGEFAIAGIDATLEGMANFTMGFVMGATGHFADLQKGHKFFDLYPLPKTLSNSLLASTKTQYIKYLLDITVRGAFKTLNSLIFRNIHKAFV